MTGPAATDHAECEKKIAGLESEVRRLKRLLAARAADGDDMELRAGRQTKRTSDWMDTLAPADREWWQRRNGGGKKK